MSRNYDNWERLVAAVLRREQDWQICHEGSITTSSRSSISSDLGSTYSFSDPFDFDFAIQKDDLCLKSAQPLTFQTVAGIRNSGVNRDESKEKGWQLVLFKGSSHFDLEGLLMAPSFVLGEKVDTFRSTYAVRFNEDTTVVAKRWGRGANAKRETLKKRLTTIQSMEHDNVVTLRGCFFNEDESFGFYDYFHQGSLHTMLHGSKGGKGSVNLDWKGRMRIAIGAAKGLLHIHKQSGNFIHGSLKSSSIFVNSKEYGCVHIKPETAIAFYYKDRLYHPPEVNLTKKLSQASDVYCFGVVLIELLSGRSPLHYHYNACVETFADWAIRNARDEWTTIVYDTELLKYSLAKQAMSDMFEVALCCVKRIPEERLDMEHVVEMLQPIPTTFRVYSN